MAPNIKVDNYAILRTAAGIAEESGARAVTSRNIARKLECPIRSVSRGKINIRKLRQAVAVLVKKKGAEAITTKSILEELMYIRWVSYEAKENEGFPFSK